MILQISIKVNQGYVSACVYKHAYYLYTRHILVDAAWLVSFSNLSICLILFKLRQYTNLYIVS